MIHTKIRGNRPVGSGTEDFLKGFYTKTTERKVQSDL